MKYTDKTTFRACSWCTAQESYNPRTFIAPTIPDIEIMRQNKTSNQLVTAWCEEQASLASQQCEGWVDICGIADTPFYLKTLSGLAVCAELVKTNAQLKEINRNKIEMLRRRINQVSARMDEFKNMLNGLQNPL